MKSFMKLLVIIVAFISAHAYAADVWSTLSQSDRNLRILNQAKYEADNVAQAGQCKTFAIEAVRIASNQANGLYGVYSDPFTRILPMTASWNGVASESYFWSSSDYNYRYVTALPGNGINPLFNAVPGSIIQMRIKLKSGGYSPHTSIVEVNNTATQVITLIESNYYGDSLVKRRWINYPDFVNALEANYEYTIYQIK